MVPPISAFFPFPVLRHGFGAQDLAAKLRELGHGAQGLSTQPVRVHGHQDGVPHKKKRGLGGRIEEEDRFNKRKRTQGTGKDCSAEVETR